VTVRRAAPTDEPFLRAVFADSKAEFFLLEPDVRDILLDMQYRGARRRIDAEHPNVERFVISFGGVDVGAMALDRSTGGTDILELSVTRTCRRQGIGTAALAEVLDGPMSTVVSVHDQASRRLYERLGFQVARESRGLLTLCCA